VFKALNIWLVSQTDLSKLVLGGVIVLIVVAFPKGIVGMLETIRNRRRTPSSKSPVVKDASCPGSSRASTSLIDERKKTWMAGTSPAMTREGSAE
jgi:hypothetical protein